MVAFCILFVLYLKYAFKLCFQEKVDNATSRFNLRLSSARQYSSQLNLAASRSPLANARTNNPNARGENSNSNPVPRQNRSQSARRSDARTNQNPAQPQQPQRRPKTGIVTRQGNSGYRSDNKGNIADAGRTRNQSASAKIQRSRPVSSQRPVTGKRFEFMC